MSSVVEESEAPCSDTEYLYIKYIFTYFLVIKNVVGITCFEFCVSDIAALRRIERARSEEVWWPPG